MKPIKNLNGFVRSLRSAGFKVVNFSSFDLYPDVVKIEYPYDFLVSVPGYSPDDLFSDLYLKTCRVFLLGVERLEDKRFLNLHVVFYDSKEFSYL